LKPKLRNLIDLLEMKSARNVEYHPHILHNLCIWV